MRGLQQLLQIHGLNLIAAIGLLVEIGNIELFETSKQLVAYAGLAASVTTVESDREARQDHKAGPEAAEDDLYKGSAESW